MIPFELQLPEGVTLNTGTNTLTGAVGTSSYSLGVSTAPVEATVSAKIDGTPTTVTTNTFSVPTTAQNIVITVEAEGYETGTYTFTNAVEHIEVSSDGNWLMLSEAQLQESYKVNGDVLSDERTFIPYNYEDPITISGTVGSNTTIELSNMWHFVGNNVGKRYALTVGIKRHSAEGYMFYPECTLNDGSTLATTGQATPYNSSGETPSTITIGSDVYDIFCFVFADSAYRFGKVELKKKSTEPDSVATVEATLTVDNTDATYEDGGSLSFTLSSSTTGVSVRNSGTRKITVNSGSWQMDDIVMNIVCGIQGVTFTAVAIDTDEQEVPLTVTGTSFTIPANNISDYSSITVKGNAGSYTETDISYMLVVN